MHGRYSLYIGILLMASGFSLFAIPNVSVAHDNKLVSQGNFVWAVSGYFDGGDKMSVYILPDIKWAPPTGGEENRIVLINVSIAASSDGHVDFASYFYFWANIGDVPSANPAFSFINASAYGNVAGSSADLTIANGSQNYIGGIVNHGGNFTISVDQQSILKNFSSNYPPGRILLMSDYFVLTPILPVSMALMVLGVLSVMYSRYVVRKNHSRKR